MYNTKDIFDRFKRQFGRIVARTIAGGGVDEHQQEICAFQPRDGIRPVKHKPNSYRIQVVYIKTPITD